MKKTFLSLIAFLVGMVSLFAQTNPNRVLLTDKTGNTTGFLAERLDSIWFARVEGRIAAEIEYLGFTQGDGTTPDKVQVAITRTSGCEAFRIDCLLKSRADLMGTEAALAAYLDQSGSEYYWQDFTGADLSGYEFTPDVEYSIVTVGYDKYGIACGVERVDFRTPKKPLVGDCTITYDVTEKTKDAVTISFTPASGVAGYAACMFNAGQAEEQFEQMGAMFGFTTLGDYVKAFGFNATEAQTFTWTSNDPGTDYEIYVQAWDVNGTYADMLVIPVTTDKIGGTGVAEMTIEIGAFQGDAINGYYQIVTYTPNEHTSMHRDIIIEQAGVRDEDLRDIEINETSSFISAPFSVAETILQAYSDRSMKGRPIVMRAKPEGGARDSRKRNSGRREASKARGRKRRQWEDDYQPYGRDTSDGDDGRYRFPDRKKGRRRK